MEQDEKFAKKKLQQPVVIKCPHCGWEWTPGEIFYPDNVLGYPINVIRDPLGHILYVEYKDDCEPLAEEEFWCEHCDRPFIATIELKCDAKPQEEVLDFSETATQLW